MLVEHSESRALAIYAILFIYLYFEVTEIWVLLLQSNFPYPDLDEYRGSRLHREGCLCPEWMGTLRCWREHVGVYTCVYTCLCVYVYMYVYLCMCVYVCAYVYV